MQKVLSLCFTNAERKKTDAQYLVTIVKIEAVGE